MKILALAMALASAAAMMRGCALPEGAARATDTLPVHAAPVEITPSELHGLDLLRSVSLSAPHEQFGGFSGLLVEDGRLTTVSDAGWLLTAPLAAMLEGGNAVFHPLPGESGRGPKSASDAESLARQGTRLAIGFERDHRIEFIEDGKRMGVLRDRRFERMASNNGIEALARLPDGALLAIGEKPIGGAFPVLLLGDDGSITTGTLRQIGGYAASGADIGPDGRLYLLRRHWSILTGWSIRIERYALDASGFPQIESRELLADFRNGGGIDNMEGIAIWRTPDGATRLAIIADDNFNPMERTLLLVFDVTG